MGNIPKIGIAVLIVNDEKILLGKRNTDPEKADSELHGEGTWCMPGGKLEFKETIEECARREVTEETGMKIKDTEIINVTNDIGNDAHFVTIWVHVKEFFGKPEVKEDDITEWNWFSLNELPEPLFIADSTKETIRKFLDRY